MLVRSSGERTSREAAAAPCLHPSTPFTPAEVRRGVLPLEADLSPVRPEPGHAPHRPVRAAARLDEGREQRPEQRQVHGIRLAEGRAGQGQKPRLWGTAYMA